MTGSEDTGHVFCSLILVSMRRGLLIHGSLALSVNHAASEPINSPIGRPPSCGEVTLPLEFRFMDYVGFLISACLVSFAYFILRVVASEFPPKLFISTHQTNVKPQKNSNSHQPIHALQVLPPGAQCSGGFWSFGTTIFRRGLLASVWHRLQCK